jgi:hypothetical protein
MMTRSAVCRSAIALGALLIIAGIGPAAPQSELPALPFDEMTTTTNDFASFATNSTPVEVPSDPTATAGQSDDVAESPEPATLTLLGLGGIGAWWQLRKRRFG